MNQMRCGHGVVSVDDSHLYAFGGDGLTCVERLDVGAIVDGESSVQWSMCPGNMLNPLAGSRCYFGHWSISGSGANKDDTYVYCAGGWATGDLDNKDVQMYSVRRGVWESLPPLSDTRATVRVLLVCGTVPVGM